MAAPTTRMRDAAQRLLAALGPAQRAAATAAFDAPEHREWTYLPGRRPGLALGELDEAQLRLLQGLLDAGLSAAGARTARDVMALDDVLRDLERDAGRSGWERRGASHYWLRVLGDPGSPVWAWRLNGHHLAVHVTVVAGRVAATPQFFGANPAVVPRGPRAGWQVLAAEELLARELLETLDGGRRAVAIVDPVAPADIATRHDPVADPGLLPLGPRQAGLRQAGLRHADLRPAQRDRLEALVRHYVGRVTAPVAGEAWRAMVAAGLGQVSFGWAGATAPGRPHYYAVTGPTFLIEYDNTQDDANHVHTVWRDLRRDWGADLLAEHHRQAHGSH